MKIPITPKIPRIHRRGNPPVVARGVGRVSHDSNRPYGYRYAASIFSNASSETVRWYAGVRVMPRRSS